METFDRLPEQKRKIIERAYFAALNGEIAQNDFFLICRKILTDAEYNSLFSAGAPQNTNSSANMASIPVREEMIEGEEPYEEIKTEHIEDIMQYTGVDLKEEADKIGKEAEYNVRYEAMENREDKASKIESVFHQAYFQDFILKAVSSRNIKITNEAIYLIFQVMKRKMLDFIDRLDLASKVRVEGDLVDFNFKIENEVSKQLWYLNEMEKALMDKLMVKKEDDNKKKKVMQEREDLNIKKKQSSSVAMAAMGIEQKSWMTGDGAKTTDEESRFTPIYAPFDEKGFDSKIKNRAITMKDFIYVLEKDKRYNKSIFLTQYYFK